MRDSTYKIGKYVWQRRRRNMRTEEQEHVERSAGTYGEKRGYIRREARVHENRSEGTREQKNRNMWREAKEHAERSEGTFGEKRRNMRRKSWLHADRSTRALRDASTCKSRTGVGNWRPSIPFHESQGYLKQFRISDPSKA